MSLLVESLHVRIDSETAVIGVQELASDFTRRGFSFIFPYDILHTPRVLDGVSYQPASTKLS